MPSLERDPHRIVIAGASSLLGAELKSLLEESRFAGWDLRLVDEEVSAGTLTVAGGEPAGFLPRGERRLFPARPIFFFRLKLPFFPRFINPRPPPTPENKPPNPHPPNNSLSPLFL